MEQNQTVQQDLAFWKDRYEKARNAYAPELEEMERRERLYLGEKEIRTPSGTTAAKSATNVRNIVFELVESQISSIIPQPKVTAVNPQNQQNARKIEDKLRNELDRLPMEVLNDQQERTTPIQGGSMILVEWDSTGGGHCTAGEISLRLLHPRQVIPQPGVYELSEMDYLFVELTQSREALEKRYGVPIEETSPLLEQEDPIAQQELVTQIIAYYRGENGIGRFSWVGDQVLEDLEDYLARRVRVCCSCGRTLQTWERSCGCGGTKSRKKILRFETPGTDIVREGRETIPAISGTGASRHPTLLPYYRMRRYPIVLRRNVSVYGKFLGGSDVQILDDQQNTIKKLATKVEEKLLKGGSYVLLPRGKTIRRTDEELKVIELESPEQKAMIDVLTVQADVSRDMAMLEQNYQWAKSTLGINDSFQGKADDTAVSGKAKEFAANQSAGRLESKRVMKQASYSELFEVMFQMLLCCADEPRPVLSRDVHGQPVYSTFSKYDFLERDAAGEWYYNDSYLFSTDVAGTMAGNREAMWQETRVNYRDGAFGTPGSPQALLMFWEVMESLSYPLAAQMKSQMEDLLRQSQMIGESGGKGGEENGMSRLRVQNEN